MSRSDKGRSVTLSALDMFCGAGEPVELAAAMGFEGYSWCGNKTEITKQIGNAVPVNMAAALLDALLGAAA